MARQYSKQTHTQPQDFITVAFVEDSERAKECKTLLDNNDIPVIVKNNYDRETDSRTIAIMVPEDRLDEAHVIIESQNAYDDFYEFAAEDEDDIDHDDDLFDDGL